MRAIPILLIIAGILAWAVPATGQTQNLMRFRPVHEGWSNCAYTNEIGLARCYLCIFDPVNPSYGEGQERAVEFIGGFECRFKAWGDIRVAEVRPVVDSHMLQYQGDTLVQFKTPVPVEAEGFTIVAEIVLMTVVDESVPEDPGAAKASPVPCEHPLGWLNMEPAWLSGISGAVTYVDADDPDDPFVAADIGEPYWNQFRVDMRTVPEDRHSWSTIKALYR